MSAGDQFGRRLAKVRKARGMTQEQLAKKVGVSRRVIAYYEAEADNLPATLIKALSKQLRVTADELLGIKS